MKQKHKWSGQLLSEFMKKPYESYTGSGGPPLLDSSVQTDFIDAYNTGTYNYLQLVWTILFENFIQKTEVPIFSVE